MINLKKKKQHSWNFQSSALFLAAASVRCASLLVSKTQEVVSHVQKKRLKRCTKPYKPWVLKMNILYRCALCVQRGLVFHRDILEETESSSITNRRGFISRVLLGTQTLWGLLRSFIPEMFPSPFSLGPLRSSRLPSLSSMCSRLLSAAATADSWCSKLSESQEKFSSELLSLGGAFSSHSAEGSDSSSFTLRSSSFCLLSPPAASGPFSPSLDGLGISLWFSSVSWSLDSEVSSIEWWEEPMMELLPLGRVLWWGFSGDLKLDLRLDLGL